MIDKFFDRGWVWAPMSGNVYRRDAIELFIGSDMLPTLRKCTDAYLNFAINAFAGSVLIEFPLAVYRIHGNNGFVKDGPLYGLVSFNRASNLSSHAAYCALMHVTKNFKKFENVSWSLICLQKALIVLRRRASDRPRENMLSNKIASYILESYWKLSSKILHITVKNI